MRPVLTFPFRKETREITPAVTKERKRVNEKLLGEEWSREGEGVEIEIRQKKDEEAEGTGLIVKIMPLITKRMYEERYEEKRSRIEKEENERKKEGK